MFHNDALLTLEIYRTGLEMPQKIVQKMRWTNMPQKSPSETTGVCQAILLLPS